MGKTKAFLYTFGISFSITLICYGILYWTIPPKSVDKNQQNVPILTAQAQDSKTSLIVLNNKDSNFFFLLKLNGIQKKVGLISIPPDFYITNSGRTMEESFEYAGIMQCVQDLSNEFDLNIHYHILCTEENLSNIISSFSGVYIDKISNFLPPSINNLIFKGTDYMDIATFTSTVSKLGVYLDNNIGIEFLNNIGIYLIKNNMDNIGAYVIDDIKKNFSHLNTNISTEDFERLKRIMSLLNNSQVEFSNVVLNQNTANEDITRLFKE